MELQLINGSYLKSDAIELITQLIQVKIKFHEDRIGRDSNEEDLKMREAKISMLQNELQDVRRYLNAKSGFVEMHGNINL